MRMNMKQYCHTVGTLVIVLLLLMLVVNSCSKTEDNSAAIARHKKLAGELRDNGLYQAAIDEYIKILQYNDINDATRANINYLIARIYFEHVKDFQQAAAYYLRAKTLAPADASFADEASRKLVASLEKMGNIIDAKRQLDAAVDIDSVPADKNDVAVARVGGVPIWLSQINDEIQSLPPDVQKQYLTRDKKIQFVHQYIGEELIYRAAVREDYGNDPEIKRKQHQFYRKLLVNKYLLDNVIPQIRIDTSDVLNYYEANKTIRYNDKPYDSVRAQVFLDYQNEKTQSAFSDYISKLAKSDRVVFYDENVK